MQKSVNIKDTYIKAIQDMADRENRSFSNMLEQIIVLGLNRKEKDDE
jgi:hypothetical protein